MLEVLGVDYIYQHILQTLQAERKELVYRVYVTDTLQIIASNTAKYASGQYVTERFIDRLNGKPMDTRTGREIADEVIAKAGLVPKNQEPEGGE